ncbi:four-carbon acid sugar kinase family protein [Microbacterium betulae]|uniref:Four-carbon acid sugar kinase family protein n=1 Tax=Microbacterium betulae TaxID=2981139 RepID=A0AA97FJ51_9MICO|nr:four-carbon acid sugar kinase family protein [Microbacterium sp. AB]WOF23688.1 four-carbon acid sugar kinase family protein [Microbacterium sp. AB]
MHVDALLAPLPAPVEVTAADVSAEVNEASLVVVLDDDPTGTQSVAHLPVLTRWEREDLDGAIATGAPAVYVLTNTRSLDEETAARRGREVVAAALAAARSVGRHVTFVSRGDSTLRGHFPLETDVLAAEIVAHGGREPALTLLVPAFPDAGRITVDAVHYWVVDGEATPVGETAFAEDATFGFSSSDLRDWVEEKTAGRILAADVAALTIDVIRSGALAVEEFLRALTPGTVVAVDVVEETDMRVVALAVHRLRDRDVLLRVGPPYVRAHIGQAIAEPVRAADIPFAHDRGGLIVVGSHVPLTTAQLDELRRARPETATIELDVRSLIDDRRDAHLDAQASAVARALADGSVVVHTTRELVTGADGEESLDIARRVSGGVVELVRRVLAIAPPRFVIAKGGITSSDVASEALEIRRATVLGPLLPGIVSLWQPETGPAVGIPYVVFAGNVGDTDSLAKVVATLADAR